MTNLENEITPEELESMEEFIDDIAFESFIDELAAEMEDLTFGELERVRDFIIALRQEREY